MHFLLVSQTTIGRHYYNYGDHHENMKNVRNVRPQTASKYVGGIVGGSCGEAVEAGVSAEVLAGPDIRCQHETPGYSAGACG